MKYELDKERLHEYYEDFINFTDWVPGMIQEELIIRGIKAGGGNGNKEIRAIHFDNQFNHSCKKRIKHYDDGVSWEEISDWECEVFLRKFPYFTPLFIIDENYVYVPPVPNKHQSTSNPISKLLRKIFSI